MVHWLGLLGVVAVDSVSFIRVNQVGYLPDAPKVAVVCSLRPVDISTFTVTSASGSDVIRSRRARKEGAFGPCVVTHRLDFTSLKSPGRYVITAGTAEPATVRIGPRVYEGGADTLLYYMSEEGREGKQAFIEKRPPDFSKFPRVP